ncbi:hypothetical protein HYV11_02440 [Candidatus Dependentiae bacterium]|nr:hypothetical protein [Candidatus Dependentiae bacterium]
MNGQNFDFQFTEKDDSELLAADLDEFDNLIASSDGDTFDRGQLKSCEAGEAAIWVNYLTALQAPELLDEDFYKSTTVRPNARNVLNYPNFFIFHFPENQVCRFYMFYNQGFKMNFTAASNKQLSCNKWCQNDGKRLGSYINIESEKILSILDNYKKLLPSQLAPLHLFDIPLVATIFANAFLEERRVALMFHYFKNYGDKTTFELKLPFIYEMHNLNFTELEKNTLQNQFALFGQNPDPNFSEIKFARKHMIMDAFGIGTLDVTVQKLLWENDSSKIYAGLALYLPTDYRLASGLYGTYYKPKNQQPILDFCDLVQDIGSDPILNPNATAILENYYLSALNHLSSMILQCPLGYNNHTAIALKLLPFWQWKENVRYSGMYIFEWLLPREEKLFYIKKPSKVPFSEQFSKMTNSQEQLDFFEATLTERLFPRVFSTVVYPGFLLNTISNLQWTLREWNYTIGYNWWYQTKEKLGDIQTSQDIIDSLDIKKATLQSSSQVKLYAKIHRDFQTKYHELSFAFYGNFTVYNQNVGDDFLVGISFDKFF